MILFKFPKDDTFLPLACYTHMCMHKYIGSLSISSCEYPATAH